MQMIEVESSNISSIGWDADNGLRVVFSSGATYDYPSVPLHVFHELSEAPSKGQYFVANIKGKYSSVKA